MTRTLHRETLTPRCVHGSLSPTHTLHSNESSSFKTLRCQRRLRVSHSHARATTSLLRVRCVAIELLTHSQLTCTCCCSSCLLSSDSASFSWLTVFSSCAAVAGCPITTGTYKPRIRCFEADQLSMKFERHLNAEGECLCWHRYSSLSLSLSLSVCVCVCDFGCVYVMLYSFINRLPFDCTLR